MAAIMAACSSLGLIILLIGHNRIAYKERNEDIEQQRLEMIEKC
jgi:MFS transporter, DHA1 family, multidrug resistance protein